MTESDSIRLARMEEKFDALADKLDERHDTTCDRLDRLEKDAESLKQDRAKAIGASAIVAFIVGSLGSLILKFFSAAK